MPFWHRAVIAAVVFVAVSVLARLIDWRLARRRLPPEAMTRYRVLRRNELAPPLDHLLDERPDLRERGVRLLRCEVRRHKRTL